jgi:hypothetical protein
MSKHPIQPLEMVGDVLRFKQNNAVNVLYEVFKEKTGIDPWHAMLSHPEVTKEDLCQFAQLIGYSHSGSGSLNHMDDQTWYAAQTAYKEGTSELEARNLYLEKRHQKMVKKLAPLCSHVFDIHLADLEPR